VVVDPMDDDDTCVRAGALGPLAKNGGEVRDVVRDEDTSFRRRKREHFRVREPFELTLFVKRANVMTVTTKRSTHAPA